MTKQPFDVCLFSGDAKPWGQTLAEHGDNKRLRVLFIEDPFPPGPDPVLPRIALSRSIAATARGRPSVQFFALTISPRCYVGAGMPANVSLGVRACNNIELAERMAALSKVKHAGHKWLSCTPREIMTLPTGADWVFCNIDEKGPIYPELTQLLKLAAKTRGVPFWFESNGGWTQTFTFRDPVVEEGDKLLRIDGVITGEIDRIFRHDNGTLKDVTGKRTPSGKKRKVSDPTTGQMRLLDIPKFPRDRSRKAAREVYIRHSDEGPQNLIEGRVYQEPPPWLKP